jgi:hypothetical protein
MTLKVHIYGQGKPFDGWLMQRLVPYISWVGLLGGNLKGLLMRMKIMSILCCLFMM